MTLLNKWALLILVGGLILASRAFSGTSQETFHVPPAEGQLEARDAVAAPHTVAHVPPPEMSEVLSEPIRVERTPGDLPDFSMHRDVPTKKAHFFGYLLPLVQAENVRITAIRKRLNYIYDHVRWQREISEVDYAWLNQVTVEFRIKSGDPSETDFWVMALERVDAVPEDLVLVQAANESAWGTSRFAREGNNLFGQWCFREGCGIVPAGRPEGATYEVARYDSVCESIGSYMHNLNTGRTYQLLREIRARMRSEGEIPDATELAAGLVDYSERGMAYVNELRAMIRHSETILDELRLSAETDGNS